MSRNWGITTSRRDVGGLDHPSGSYRADTQRELKSVAAAGPLPASRRNSRELGSGLFTHPFEIGSTAVFFAVVLFPIAVVSGLCLGYAAYAPEPVEYAARFKAN